MFILLYQWCNGHTYIKSMITVWWKHSHKAVSHKVISEVKWVDINDSWAYTNFSQHHTNFSQHHNAKTESKVQSVMSNWKTVILNLSILKHYTKLRVCSINYITPNLTAIADSSSSSSRGADKSLARPGRKQANVSVRMAWISFGALPSRKRNLMTARVSILLKSRASLTCFRACFLPGRAKNLSAPR